MSGSELLTNGFCRTGQKAASTFACRRAGRYQLLGAPPAIRGYSAGQRRYQEASLDRGIRANRMLRKAEPRDAEAIGKVRVAAWRAAYQHFMPKEFLKALDPANNLAELKERLSNQSSDFTLSVAEDLRQVVAFSIVGKPRYEAAGKTIELWALNVLPEYWRMGIGSRLVERAITYALDAGFESIELWCIKGNTPAQEAYKKLGFTESGQERSSSQLTGNTLHELHYIKVL
ncbi:N-acetyltransferase family protein [Marinimicrobium sp. ARAG 43.8]|uniref:GNAT family N-acetyltransferase n=1 Tax=Marinimicrobium sp. ARAG 43.8 TaxID=3418719 RepID=UPI003CECF5D8